MKNNAENNNIGIELIPATGCKKLQQIPLLPF